MNNWFQESTPAHHEAESVAAYLLGALEAVACCSDCRKEVTELYPVRQILPTMVPQATPPDHVRLAVLSKARKEVALFKSAQPDEIFTPPAAWYRQRLAPSVAWAAICTALFLGILGGGQFENLIDPGANDTRMMFATVNPEVAPMVQASLQTVGSDAGATLTLRRLPEPQADQAYQVWIRNSERSPLEAVTTKLRKASLGVNEITLDRKLKEVDELVLTLETGEIGSKPNGQAILNVNLGNGPVRPTQAVPSI
jgi:hypothetical protein